MPLATKKDLANPPWKEANSRILIVRLSSLEDVASSTSHLVLFSELRKAMPNSYIDFSFFPGTAERRTLQSLKMGYFYGVSSLQSLSEFTLVLISNATTLELVNICYIHTQNNIPLSTRDRLDIPDSKITYPLLIVGGSNAAACGSLFTRITSNTDSYDCLVDGIFFGEGDSAPDSAVGRKGCIAELAKILCNVDLQPRQRLDLAVKEIEGFWGAGSNKKVKSNRVIPHPKILTHYPILDNQHCQIGRIQISAGCPCLCSFCLEGWDRKPYREMPASYIIEEAIQLRLQTGIETLELFSFNFNMHSDIKKLIVELNKYFYTVVLTSQRADGLAKNDGLLDMEAASGKMNYTLGIEGISESLRRFYEKDLSEKQIILALTDLARLLPKGRLRGLKLFFILSGLEEDNDIAEFELLAQKIADIFMLRKNIRGGLRIVISVAYLVRMPGTPLQYTPLCLDKKRLSLLAMALQRICEENQLEFRLSMNYTDYFLNQILCIDPSTLQLAKWLGQAPENNLVFTTRVCTQSGNNSTEAELIKSFTKLLPVELVDEKHENWESPLLFLRADTDRERNLYHRYTRLKEARAKLAKENLHISKSEKSYPTAELVHLHTLMQEKAKLATVHFEMYVPEELAHSSLSYKCNWVTRQLFAKGGTSLSPTALAESLLNVETALKPEDSPWPEYCWGIMHFTIRGKNIEVLCQLVKQLSGHILQYLPPLFCLDMEITLPHPYGAGAKKALHEWLAEARVSFTEYNTQKGKRLQVSPRHLKKHFMYWAELQENSNLWGAQVQIGQKARIDEWLKRISPLACRAASIKITKITPGVITN